MGIKDIVQELDSLTDEELIVLQFEVARHLDGRPSPANRPPSNEGYYWAGYRKGYDDAFDFFEEYLNPIIAAWGSMNAAVYEIFGLVEAGFGKLPKEQIKLADQALHAMIRGLEQALLEASNVMDVSGVFDMTVAKAVRRAANSYYSGYDPEGKELRQIAAQRGEIHFSIMALRMKLGLKPGAGSSDANVYMRTKGWELARELKFTGNNKGELSSEEYKLIGKRLFDRLDRIRMELIDGSLEKAAYTKLSKCRFFVKGQSKWNWDETKLRNTVRNAMKPRNPGKNVSTKLFEA